MALGIIHSIGRWSSHEWRRLRKSVLTTALASPGVTKTLRNKHRPCRAAVGQLVGICGSTVTLYSRGALVGRQIARVAANLIPQKVVGMVLIDSTHEDEILGITVGANDSAVRPRKLSATDWDKISKPPVTAPGAPRGPPWDL